jgi:flavin reductase (DIM6/NTAB) family NADH-FMN oxidoreductase RutF
MTLQDWLPDAISAWGQPATPIAADLFRPLMGSFPTGVTIVTTIDENGEPRGMTLNAFMSVSSDPPLLAICVANRSATLAAIRRTGAFAVHVLDERSAHLSKRFSQPAATFDGLFWHRSSTALGVPLLGRGTVAVAECLVDRIVPTGDHELVIGRIVGGRHTEDEPLLYHRRRYASWPATSASLSPPSGTIA